MGVVRVLFLFLLAAPSGGKVDRSRSGRQRQKPAEMAAWIRIFQLGYGARMVDRIVKLVTKLVF